MALLIREEERSKRGAKKIVSPAPPPPRVLALCRWGVEEGPLTTGVHPRWQKNVENKAGPGGAEPEAESDAPVGVGKCTCGGGGGSLGEEKL